MERRIFAENIRIDGKWQESVSVLIKNGFIQAIEVGKNKPCDSSYAFVCAGLIDNHTHGGLGFSFSNGNEASAESYLLGMSKRGICGIVGASYGSYEAVRNALRVAKNVKDSQQAGRLNGAELLGIHMEGPFLNPKRCGSMATVTLKTPSIEIFKFYTEGYEDILLEVSLAPELDDGYELIKHLKEQGVRVLAGHTDCTYKQAISSFEVGIGATCHTFNAMRPIHHREPSIISAALVDTKIYCEIIGDLVHLDKGAIKLLHTCKGAKRLMLISDSVSPTGLDDGIYQLDGFEVLVKNGEARLADGTLYGGGCFISESIRRLYKQGFSPKDLLLIASEAPADWLGLSDWKIAVGNKVRLSCFDYDMKVKAAFIGEKEYICE